MQRTFEKKNKTSKQANSFRIRTKKEEITAVKSYENNAVTDPKK